MNSGIVNRQLNGVNNVKHCTSFNTKKSYSDWVEHLNRSFLCETILLWNTSCVQHLQKALELSSDRNIYRWQNNRAVSISVSCLFEPNHTLKCMICKPIPKRPYIASLKTRFHILLAIRWLSMILFEEMTKM